MGIPGATEGRRGDYNSLDFSQFNDTNRVDDAAQERFDCFTCFTRTSACALFGYLGTVAGGRIYEGVYCDYQNETTSNLPCPEDYHPERGAIIGGSIALITAIAMLSFYSLRHNNRYISCSMPSIFHTRYNAF